MQKHAGGVQLQSMDGADSPAHPAASDEGTIPTTLIVASVLCAMAALCAVLGVAAVALCRCSTPPLLLIHDIKLLIYDIVLG